MDVIGWAGEIKQNIAPVFLAAASSTLNSFKSFNDKLNYVAMRKSFHFRKNAKKAFNYKCINQPTNAHFEVSPLESAFGREVEMYALHNFLTVIYTQAEIMFSDIKH